MTKRFIPVLAACLFLMVGTAQAATSLAFPPPDTKGGKPLMQTLSGRATNRSFTAKPLSDKLLGDLLWAAYGVNRPNGKRTIPTAQNRQDLEIYVLRSDGAWLYDAPKHSLEQVSSSDLRNFLAGQGFHAGTGGAEDGAGAFQVTAVQHMVQLGRAVGQGRADAVAVRDGFGGRGPHAGGIGTRHGCPPRRPGRCGPAAGRWRSCPGCGSWCRSRPASGADPHTEERSGRIPRP